MKLGYERISIIGLIMFCMIFCWGETIGQTTSEDTFKENADSVEVIEKQVNSKKLGKSGQEADTLEKQIMSVVSSMKQKEKALEEKKIQLEKKEKKLNRFQWISWIIFAIGIIALGLTIGMQLKRKTKKKSRSSSSTQKK